MPLRLVLCGAALVSILAIPGAAGAATIVVETTEDTSLDDAFCSLREAVDSANSGEAGNSGCEDGDLDDGVGGDADTIVLGTGTYALSGNSGEDANLEGDLDVTKDLTFEGAGAGATAIDAADLDRAIDVHSDGAVSGVDLLVESLTIENGAAIGSGDSGDGGGIRMRDANGTVTIDRAVLRASHADRWGGAFSFDDSINGQQNLRIVESEFVGNDADGKGGAVWFRSTGSPDGIVTRSTFFENRSDAAGGAIYLGGPGEGPEGPGTPAPALQIVNSTLAGNVAAGGGGAVALGSANPQLFVYFSTLAGNATTRDDGAGALQTDNDAQWVHIVGSILAGNLRDGATVNCAEPDTAVSDGAFAAHQTSYSIEDADSCDLVPMGNGNLIGTEPLLAPLALNSPGPTRTQGLEVGSPALDLVPPSACDPLVPGAIANAPVDGIDQRGVPRPAGFNCDAGSFEGVLARDPEGPKSDPQPPSRLTPGVAKRRWRGATDGNDILLGTVARDRICGMGGSDLIKGMAGPDALFGDDCEARISAFLVLSPRKDGDDRLYGGHGKDMLHGGAGDDMLRGGAGDDRLIGGGGDDFLRGGKGANLFRAGPGSDTVQARNGTAETVNCGWGEDRAKADPADRVSLCEKVAYGTPEAP